jgi:DNA-binding protein HU-beta
MAAGPLRRRLCDERSGIEDHLAATCLIMRVVGALGLGVEEPHNRRHIQQSRFSRAGSVWQPVMRLPACENCRDAGDTRLGRQIAGEGIALNRTQLVDGVLARVDADRKSVERIVGAVLDEIIAEVTRGGRVVLAGFGTFERRARAARTARNPQTGAAVKVKKRNVPAFKVGATFKDTVAAGKVSAKKAAAKKTTAQGAARKTAPASKATASKATAKRAPAKKAAVRGSR